MIEYSHELMRAREHPGKNGQLCLTGGDRVAVCLSRMKLHTVDQVQSGWVRMFALK